MVCPASVVEIAGTFTPGPRAHCHPCDPGLLVNTELKVKVKQDAKANIYMAAGALVNRAWVEIVDIEKHYCLQSKSSLEHVPCRARSRHRPTEPGRDEMNFEVNIYLILIKIFQQCRYYP